MENQYALRMAKKSDEELSKIVSTQRNDYQMDALLAAELELRKRNIWSESLEQSIAVTNQTAAEVKEFKFARYCIIKRDSMG